VTSNVPLPARLEDFVRDYPNEELRNGSRIFGRGKGKKLEVRRIRRMSRFHSRNLILSAG
jgi:hypothetical protein